MTDTSTDTSTDISAAVDAEAVTGLATAPEDATALEDRRLGRSSTQEPPAPHSRWGKLTAEPRKWWRQLTSMRTALVLLFLLAVAAVPGSTFPQRKLNEAKVEAYFVQHPKLAPLMDKLSLFDVFASPWFAAIYLLLFVSLVGCLVPRIRVHARALVRKPPAAPRHLDRLPFAAVTDLPVGTDPSRAADDVRDALRRGRWRTVVRTEPSGAVTVSAEKGYLRETGNLAFHIALVALLIGVASGSLWGWKASVLVTEGTAFCDTVQAYDSFTPGTRMRDVALPSFCVQLDDFQATYQASGQPKDFKAKVRYIQGSKAVSQDPNTAYTLEVNHPLRLHGANIYLINHGYAPVLKFTDRYGTVFEETPAFLPQDAQMTSEGSFILPDANQDPKATKRNENSQIAFTGFFVPTAPPDGEAQTPSLSPLPENPAVVLVGYRGDTGLDSGIAHSVYSLDQHQVDSGALKSIGSKKLAVGQVWKLGDGSSLAFEGYKEFMTVQVGHDPGELIVLGAAGFMLIGLVSSLTVRRRRLFVRVRPDGGFAVGGLARTDPDRYAEEFDRVVERLVVAVRGPEQPVAGRTENSDTPGASDASATAGATVPTQSSGPLPASAVPADVPSSAAVGKKDRHGG